MPQVATAEHRLQFGLADYASELACYAVHQDQDRQENLYRPKMRPYDLVKQLWLAAANP
jgi:hypothetical protein